MSAARRAGLIDRALLHDDYQLADELYDLAVKLGGGLLALICPNHRRTKTLQRFPRSGMHYAMLCLGNEALQSEEEFEKDEEENGVFTIPTGQGHRKPTIAGAALSGNNAGPGGAGGPCSAGVQRPENGTGHTAGEFALRHQSSRFIAAMHTYQTKYGWYKLRIAPNMNDVRMLLSDKLAVDSAHKLKQRAFRFHGLLLTDSDASKFVSRFVVREHTFLRTARNASGEVYGNIQTAAQYNVAMMDAEDLSDQPQHAGGPAAHIFDPEPRLLETRRPSKTAKNASASLTVEEKQALADATAATKAVAKEKKRLADAA